MKFYVDYEIYTYLHELKEMHQQLASRIQRHMESLSFYNSAHLIMGQIWCDESTETLK